MSEGDFERLLKEALAAEARPMSAAQVGEVVARAAALRPAALEFPLWVAPVSGGCLAALVLLAGAPGGSDWFRVLAGAAVAGNLALSPLAALVLVRRRRNQHAS